MAKFCFCGQPVFGKGFCKQHTYMRPDFDSRSIMQKAMDNNKLKTKVRGLIDEGEDSITALKADLDRITSQYIRYRDTQSDGFIYCFCCGKKITYANADCMHFIPRRHLTTRWLTDNLRAGCKNCNQYTENGNLKLYAENLEKEKSGSVEFLEEQSRQIANVSVSDLKELLIEMQFKLKLVENKLK